MSTQIEPAGSRGELIGHRQIELLEENNRLLREILRRMPTFTILPSDSTSDPTSSAEPEAHPS